MKNLYSNKIIRKISPYAYLMTHFIFTHAQGCSLGTDDAPVPSAIACVVGRIIQIAITSAGGVFTAMIGYGAIKMAMANGDPKGYEGAKLTWQWAVIGIFVILGCYMIFSVVGRLFGFSVAGGDSMVGAFSGAINDLFDLAINGEN